VIGALILFGVVVLIVLLAAWADTGETSGKAPDNWGVGGGGGDG
jgi:hypothetical protein